MRPDHLNRTALRRAIEGWQILFDKQNDGFTGDADDDPILISIDIENIIVRRVHTSNGIAMEIL